MAYCRWSSNDFQCDLYVYESDYGWHIHVAGRRHVFDRAQLPPPVSPADDPEAWVERHQVLMGLIRDAELMPIGGPYDGENYLEDSPGAAADRVEMLMDAGYVVPEYVAEELRREHPRGSF